MHLQLALREKVHDFDAGEQGYKPLEQALSCLLAVLWTDYCTRAPLRFTTQCLCLTILSNRDSLVGYQDSSFSTWPWLA